MKKKAHPYRVRPKKKLGQHFLTDERVAKRTADLLDANDVNVALEIGPGNGVLTDHLLRKINHLIAVELDYESIPVLRQRFAQALDLPEKGKSFEILHQDVLKMDVGELAEKQGQLAIIGNFPYNISSQILFQLLENRNDVPFLAGMFQQEVAERVAAKEGSKTYGILSVLTQAFYQVEYAFTVEKEAFYPPPKVTSAVISLHRLKEPLIHENIDLFFRVVKKSFQLRRKTLRNSLKTFQLSDKLRQDRIFAQRPEQLSVPQFVELTKKIAHDGN